MTTSPATRPHSPRAEAEQALLTPQRAARLRVFNAVLAVVHAAQAVAILLLSPDFALTVSETFPEGPPGTATPAPEAWLDIALGPAVAAFLLLAALDHALVAAPGVHRRYEAVLRRGRNPFRWTEYSVSATIMILLIALVSGITDITALIGIAGANIAMILFGLRMERVNDQADGTVDWEPFVFGCIVGLLPWIAFDRLRWRGRARGDSTGDRRTVVYASSFFSLFVQFFSSPSCSSCRVPPRGPLPRYVTGETAYLVLSLVARARWRGRSSPTCSRPDRVRHAVRSSSGPARRVGSGPDRSEGGRAAPQPDATADREQGPSSRPPAANIVTPTISRRARHRPARPSTTRRGGRRAVLVRRHVLDGRLRPSTEGRRPRSDVRCGAVCRRRGGCEARGQRRRHGARRVRSAPGTRCRLARGR
jgi:hypothetical protein